MNIQRKKIAIIGAGISGLCAALQLHKIHDVTLYEETNCIGGHAYTHDLLIDMGVVIISERASASFFELIKMLNVNTHAVTLSFAAQFNDSTYWSNYHCQSQLWKEIKSECDTFTMDMNSILNSSNSHLNYSLGDFLTEKKYSMQFINKALIPLLSLIAACRSSLLKTNIKTCALYFSNHRLSFFNPTLFRAFPNGTQTYTSILMQKLKNIIRLNTPIHTVTRNDGKVFLIDNIGNQEKYDEVIFATQAYITRKILNDISEEESEILRSFHYESATTLLHTDASLLIPSPNKNLIHYKKGAISIDANYYTEQLGMQSFDKQYIVTVQPAYEISSEKVVAVKHWQHTANNVNLTTIRKNLGKIQGKNHTWYCGADTSFPAHGYACASGFIIAEKLNAPYPFIEKPWVNEERHHVKNIMGLP